MTSYFLLTLFGLGCGCRAGRAGFWRLWGDRHHGRHILWLGVPLAKGRRAGGGESRFLDRWRFGCGRGLRGWRPLFQTARGRRAEAWTLPKGHKHRREVRRWAYTRLYYRQWEMQFEQQIVKVWNQTIILRVKPLQAKPDLRSYLAAPGEGALVMVLAAGEGDGDRWRLEGEAGRFPTGDVKRFSVSPFCFYKCKKEKNKRDHTSSTMN